MPSCQASSVANPLSPSRLRHPQTCLLAKVTLTPVTPQHGDVPVNAGAGGGHPTPMLRPQVSLGCFTSAFPRTSQRQKFGGNKKKFVLASSCMDGCPCTVTRCRTLICPHAGAGGDSCVLEGDKPPCRALGTTEPRGDIPAPPEAVPAPRLHPDPLLGCCSPLPLPWGCAAKLLHPTTLLLLTPPRPHATIHHHQPASPMPGRRTGVRNPAAPGAEQRGTSRAASPFNWC